MEDRKETGPVDDRSKDKQLDLFREDSKDTFLTTDQGVRMSNTDISLKAGPRGPTIMDDFHFREKMTHFDHERIPERVVHARGSGAHGYFECLAPMGEYTTARFLSEAGKKTPVFVRFSTVVGSRGSADTVRDARGFATKFYTEEGNYDLVTNNIPVFFIQDGIKFPDVVHAIKPEPDNEIPQASAAHDTFWDFVRSHQETAHMIMWLLSDRGIPRSFRMMDGFSVNTFRLVNAQGRARFVKFIWKSALGVHSLVWDEAQKIAGKDPDFHRRDLWEAIEMGDLPEYELHVQMIEEADEHSFDFDILDATKHWPEEVVPPKLVGRMVLNRNPDNFFAETEQAAFHPGNVVPGIDFSNDPLLQGRLFSYIDTQLIRLGGPNFHEIPINRPIAPVHNNQRDGYHRMTINKGKVSYFPNTLANGSPRPASREEGGYVHYAEKVEGVKIRERSEKFKDFFSQARLFWNSMSPPEKNHIIHAFHFEVGNVKDMGIRQGVVDMFANVDLELARKIAEGVGANPPSKGADAKAAGKAPSFSMENTRKDTVVSRRIAILAEEGFSGRQLAGVKRALEEEGGHVQIVSEHLGDIKGDDGSIVSVDKNHHTAASVMYDAIFIPGGRGSADAMKTKGFFIHFVNEAFKHRKPIGALGEGVDFLGATNIVGVELAGERSNDVISDKGVVTARDTPDMGAYARALIQSIAQHRHWVREMEKLKDQVPA